MPIRPELRKFYGRHWRQVIRPRILARARNRCEQCGKPNRTTVLVARAPDLPDVQYWIGVRSKSWRDCHGQSFPSTIKILGQPRGIRVVLTVAHLNWIPGDDREENLRALCQWCHLHHDRAQHKFVRCARKDAQRPLLAALEAP
jgi:hypothetical protein